MFECFFNTTKLLGWEEEFMQETNSIVEGRDAPAAYCGSYNRTTRDQFRDWCKTKGYDLSSLWREEDG